jgi:ATP-dependent Lon protease
MACALVSLATGVPLRRDVAMTGEITLRGRVLSIGGLKEKVLAALRQGITTVVIPDGNQKDLVDLPAQVRRRVTLVPARTVDEALAAALERPAAPRRAPAPVVEGGRA